MRHSINASVIERWGMLEVGVSGTTNGNPFVDDALQGVFRHQNETVKVDGFYDGEGIYRVRFMPSYAGEYTYRITGNCLEEEVTGAFTAVAPTGNNHGPVRVANTYHFAYEDGMPFYPIGTTCYAWTHQAEPLRKQTLETLRHSPFNKIRFCVFPKHYVYNFHEPETYPYEGTPCDASGLNADTFRYEGALPGNDWDFTRFNPEHFRRIEHYIEALLQLGIQADVIVMHPYDRWGFRNMGAEADDLYWHYVVNRFSAYRNVWWSLANEYDFMPEKTIADWERYASIILKQDPYNRLRSIHNGRVLYDHHRPWVTHCSYQRVDTTRTAEETDNLRLRYQKPVVLDEICYEGNIEHGWGNISGQEMTRRFWEAMCRGGYPGHGETFDRPDGILWWSHGGQLHGDSPKRIAFMRSILEAAPGHGLMPMRKFWDVTCAAPQGMLDDGRYYLVYFGIAQPAFRRFHFDDETTYQVDVIDTWDMTITPAGCHKGRMNIPLPGKPYMAVRFQKQNA